MFDWGIKNDVRTTFNYLYLENLKVIFSYESRSVSWLSQKKECLGLNFSKRDRGSHLVSDFFYFYRNPIVEIEILYAFSKCVFLSDLAVYKFTDEYFDQNFLTLFLPPIILLFFPYFPNSVYISPGCGVVGKNIYR